MSGTKAGPTVTILASCRDCMHCRADFYACQGDSGHDVSCLLEKRAIGDSTWQTPGWCPLLPAALTAAAKEVR
jgi:hypothetical protein